MPERAGSRPSIPAPRTNGIPNRASPPNRMSRSRRSPGSGASGSIPTARSGSVAARRWRRSASGRARTRSAHQARPTRRRRCRLAGRTRSRSSSSWVRRQSGRAGSTWCCRERRTTRRAKTPTRSAARQAAEAGSHETDAMSPDSSRSIGEERDRGPADRMVGVSRAAAGASAAVERSLVGHAGRPGARISDGRRPRGRRPHRGRRCRPRPPRSPRPGARRRSRPGPRSSPGRSPQLSVMNVGWIAPCW